MQNKLEKSIAYIKIIRNFVMLSATKLKRKTFKKMKKLSKLKFELLVKNQKGNSAADSTRKELASSNLKEVGKITSEDLGFEINEIVIGKIYFLQDCFLVIIDTYEEDYAYYTERIDEAQKLASDKVYEYSSL